MKLLKELFSSNRYDSEDEYGGERDDEEFDFDFDFKPDEGEEELDFDHRMYPDEEADEMGMGELESEDEFGAEEDYPEDMMDMPHDDYDPDGEGGLVSDDDMGEEIEDIKGEIESLYARLGKLAAAGDLDLADDEGSFGEVDMDDEPDFSSFQGMGFSEEEPDFGEEDREFGGEDEMDMGFDPEEDERGLPLDRPEIR